MTTRKTIGVAAVIVVIGVLLFTVANWQRIKREWAIDKCLDKGGCWVDRESRCEFKDQTACMPMKQ